MIWHDKHVVFDTETTGFGKDARVIEIALVEYRLGLVAPTMIFSTLLNPGEIDWEDKDVKKALEVNGLKKEWLADAPSFKDVGYYIMMFLKGQNWVAHNLKFDERMLRQEFDRINYDLPFPNIKIDTILCDVGLNPGKKSRKLIDVAKRWKIPLNGGHRAVNDTMATARIFQKMKKLLPETEEKFCNLQQEWQKKRKRETGY